MEVTYWVIKSIFYTRCSFFQASVVLGFLTFTDAFLLLQFLQLSDVWMSLGSNKGTHTAL